MRDRAQTAASSAVECSRRYRQRQREGWRVVKLPVHDEYVEALVSHGFLDESDFDDRQKITEAIDLFLFVLGEGAIEIDLDHFA